MGNETSKTKQFFGPLEHKILKGKGIDIGCGPDPVMPSAQAFDIDDGDANCITQYVNEKYDYVFSSHCLEHMHKPNEAIQEWWKLVKKDGHLLFTVPDEDLYEQGYFPSLFNYDHKHTFTISKHTSWSDKTINILDLLATLPDSEVIKVELQEMNYKRNLLFHSVYSRSFAYSARKWCRKIARIFRIFGGQVFIYNALLKFFKLPIDQTQCGALAQIFIIVKKI